MILLGFCWKVGEKSIAGRWDKSSGVGVPEWDKSSGLGVPEWDKSSGVGVPRVLAVERLQLRYNLAVTVRFGTDRKETHEHRLQDPDHGADP